MTAIVGLLLMSSSQPAQSKIKVGQTVQGSLSASDEKMEEDGSLYDLYTMTARKGQRVVIELTSPSFDPYVTLLEDDGTEILSADGDRGGSAARIQTTLRYTGEYLVRVNGLHTEQNKGGSGRYTLTIKSP
jgi:hypothetical protein